MPTVNGILETALYVSDVVRSADFYRQLFEFDTVAHSDRLIALRVSERSVLLIFNEGATHEPLTTPSGVIPPHRGSGPTHFAFSIAKADVAVWRQMLRARSVAIESEVTWPSGTVSIYFRDPDQNLVELITPGFWRGIVG